MLSLIAVLAMVALAVTTLAGHHDNGHYPWGYVGPNQKMNGDWFEQPGYSVRPIHDKVAEGESCHRSPRERTPAFLCDGDEDDCDPGPSFLGR